MRVLVAMGPGHNRFYVGGVVAGILRSLGEGQLDEVMMASEVLRRDGRDTSWFAEYLVDVPLVRPIADAFQAAGVTPNAPW